MSGNVPPSSPHTYMQILQATRQDYPEEYLKEHLPEVGKVKSKTLGNWKVFLYLIKNTGELVVAFEETNFLTPGKVKDVTKSFFCEDTKTIELMNKQLDQWAKKRGNITTFVGFSQGGYFADRVKKSWDTWRFTYNAHDAKAGPKNINFASEKGITFLPNSPRTVYTFIGKGGHSFNEGAHHIKPHSTWSDFL